MSQLTILKTELALPAYSGMTDQECLDALQTQNIAVNQAITTRSIEMYLQAQNKLYSIYNHASSQAKTVVLTFARFSEFDMTVSEDSTVLNALLDALVSATVLTAGEKTAIINKGTKYISRAEQLGLSNSFGIGLVIDARAA